MKACVVLVAVLGLAGGFSFENDRRQLTWTAAEYQGCSHFFLNLLEEHDARSKTLIGQQVAFVKTAQTACLNRYAAKQCQAACESLSGRRVSKKDEVNSAAFDACKAMSNLTVPDSRRRRRGMTTATPVHAVVAGYDKLMEEATMTDALLQRASLLERRGDLSERHLFESMECSLMNKEPLVHMKNSGPSEATLSARRHQPSNSATNSQHTTNPVDLTVPQLPDSDGDPFNKPVLASNPSGNAPAAESLTSTTKKASTAAPAKTTAAPTTTAAPAKT